MLSAYVHRGGSAANRQRLEEVMALFPILGRKDDPAAGSLSGRPAADGGHRPR